VLHPADEEFLRRQGLDYDVASDAGLTALVIKRWPVPGGYEPREVDLLLRLPPGFPDVQPDMYWVDPPIRLSITKAYPPGADLFEDYLGRHWQRFSRHLPPGAWQPGRDSLASYTALIRTELIRAAS